MSPPVILPPGHASLDASPPWGPWFQGHGTPVLRSAGPRLLSVPRRVGWLAEGTADLFLSRVERAGEGDAWVPTGALTPLGRRETGQLLLPVALARDNDGEASGDGVAWGVVALLSPEARLLETDLEALLTWLTGPGLGDSGPAVDLALALALSNWAETLASARGATPPMPREGISLGGASARQTAVSLAPGATAGAYPASIWLAWPGEGCRLQGEHAFPRPDYPLAEGEEGVLLLPRGSWLGAHADLVLAPREGATLSVRQQLAGLLAWQGAQMARLVRAMAELRDAESSRLQRRGEQESQRLQVAMGRLARILEKPGSYPGTGSGGLPDPDTQTLPGDSSQAKLLAACRRVGEVLGVDFRPPPGWGEVAVGGRHGAAADTAPLAAINELVEASSLRRRQVALKGEWWQQEGPPLLAFAVAEDGAAVGRPVALLPEAGGYRLVDPSRGGSWRVDRELASEIHPFAHMFYRSLGQQAVGLWALFRFGAMGAGRDMAQVAAMGIAVGLLGMVVPMVTGLLFDSVIPSADRSQLLQLTLALVAGALATVLFELTRGYALLRLEGRMDASVQAGVWDRLLRLPVTFFRDYSAGDLAMRANGINTIRQALSGHTLHTLLAVVFSVFNLGLLFYYSGKLALVALGLVLIAMLFTVAASLWRLRFERQLAATGGRLAGMVLQFLGGVAKLRMAGAEGRAFCNWAMLYARQQEQMFKAQLARIALDVFGGVFPVLANMVLFAVIAFAMNRSEGFSTGAFLGFNAAFGGFLGAMLGATGALIAVLDMVPVYERAKPILETLPETTAARAHPGALRGEIEISHVSFAYRPDAPAVLQDVSLHVAPGAFVAVVGASGSGKSTLLRLLLGFETPSSGSLYYDRQDLSGLDLGALRRQLGVVLQNGQLLSGDIFTNIVGSAAHLTLDDAWQAAEAAGIAPDIRTMPMGMHTLVSDGGGTLSGGQRQRLLIARAIVNRPRILFFDEATSALDNRTQAMVSESLESLQATRIVIAHRLSTIVNADCIHVLAGGRLVESGTYPELMARQGHFYQLASRQLL